MILFYIDSVILPLIKYLFKVKQKYFINAETLITDSLGNLVGIVYKYRQYIRKINKSIPFHYNDILAKMFFNKEIDFAFQLDSDLFRYFIIKNNRISVTKRFMTKCKETIYKIVPLEEFMGCCFDKTNWGK